MNPTPHTTPSTLAGDAEVTPLCILVIDDDHAYRSALQMLLEQHGHQVFAASNAVKALTLFAIQKDEIDVVLLDYLMPNMDGAQTLVHLRAICPSVKVILHSGAEELRLRQAFPREQIVDYLRKPLSSQQVLRALQQIKKTPTHPPR